MRSSRRRNLLAGVAVLAASLYLGSHAGEALVVTVPVERPDAIVSLASHEWERLPETARLAQANPAALVLLTEPSTPSRHNCHRCSLRTQDLAGLGVKGDRVRVLKLTAAGTYGEAVAVREAAPRLGVRRLLVVTSPYHARRSLAVFRRVLSQTVETIGVMPAEGSSPARPARWWLAPYDRAYVAYEWAARVWYWPRYGVTFLD